MQLTAASRREVIEDLLDIKIFSSMNTIIKEKIRGLRDEIRTLDLKKESINDKVNMQENFIEEIEKRGKKNINDKENKIQGLLNEENDLVNACGGMTEELEDSIKKLNSILVPQQNFANLVI